MKRLFSVFALCTTALIATSTVSSPAAADGRHDGRRHASQPNHQMSWNFALRGEHRRAFRDNREHRRAFRDNRERRRAFRDNRERRHHKFRRHNKRHRPGYLFSFSYYGHRPYYGYSYGYPGYYRYPRPIYVQPSIQYIEPSPVYAAPPAVQQYTNPPPAQLPEGCRMIREYQTQITAGGRLVDAYGDACLKADGSWERGAPKIVPE